MVFLKLIKFLKFFCLFSNARVSAYFVSTVGLQTVIDFVMNFTFLTSQLHFKEKNNNQLTYNRCLNIYWISEKLNLLIYIFTIADRYNIKKKALFEFFP